MTAARVILAVAGAVYVLLAIAALLQPDFMAAGMGYRLDNIDARNEYSAVYVGLWLATAAIFAIAARSPDPKMLLVCLLLVAGQVLGRTISVVVDGLPGLKSAPAIAIELVGTIVLALLLKRSRAAG